MCLARGGQPFPLCFARISSISCRRRLPFVPPPFLHTVASARSRRRRRFTPRRRRSTPLLPRAAVPSRRRAPSRSPCAAPHPRPHPRRQHAARARLRTPSAARSTSPSAAVLHAIHALRAAASTRRAAHAAAPPSLSHAAATTSSRTQTVRGFARAAFRTARAPRSCLRQ